MSESDHTQAPSDASPNQARAQPGRKPVVNAVSRGQGTAGANAQPSANPSDLVSASHPAPGEPLIESPVLLVASDLPFSPSEIHFLTGAISARIESLRAGVVSGGSLLNPNTSGVAARESLIAIGTALLARLQGTAEAGVQPQLPTEVEG